MNNFASDPLTLYSYIFVGGFVAIYFWRFLGLVFADRLAIDSEILIWVRLVANALMAALVARIVFLPPGTLETTLLSNRLIALFVGILGYFFLGRKLFIAVICAISTFIALEMLIKKSLF